MSLKTKIIMIVLLVCVVYISTDYVIHRFLVFPNFIKLEQNAARKDASRAIAAIEREIYHLDKFTTDWAYWDDAYLFIKDRNNEFIDSNLSPISVFSENKINLIYFIDLNRNVVWGKTFDLGNDKELEELHGDSGLNLLSLIHGQDDLKSNSGLFVTKYGVFIICSAPILKSDLEGPANGTLIMGRVINENVIQTLSEQTKLDLTLWNFGDNTIPSADKAIFSKMQQNEKHIISLEPVSASHLHCYTIFYDITDQPALLARISIPRDISRQGERAVFIATLSIVVAGSLFIVLLLFLLNIHVSKPISILTENVIQVNEGGKIFPFSDVHRTDEIGILAQEFNCLIEKLDHEISGHKKTINDLETAFSEIKTLRGLIPICAHCKKIRDDSGLWNRIEAYISAHSQASFSHGICPECIEKHYLKNHAKFSSKNG
jgi:sensor domain CHASE-containing protein